MPYILHLNANPIGIREVQLLGITTQIDRGVDAFRAELLLHRVGIESLHAEAHVIDARLLATVHRIHADDPEPTARLTPGG